MRRAKWSFVLLALAAGCSMFRRTDGSRPMASSAAAVTTPFVPGPKWSSPVSSTGTLLASNGVAAMPIIVAAKASAETRRAAEELASFLGRGTGGHFEVTTGDGSHGIVVGTAQEFDAGPDGSSLATKSRFDGPEAYVVRSEPNRVLVVGATDLGVTHAVYGLLNALGFRWFFPAKEWEELPEAPTLRADVHVVTRPRLLSRRMSPGFGFFDGQAQKDWESWGRRNGLGGSLDGTIGHAWEAIIARNKKDFDAHPEYYAIFQGKRLPYKLCVSNPAVQKMAIDYAMKALENPNVSVVSMEASDGLGYCECERCKALGPPGAQPIYLANMVAKEVEKKHPGKLVGLLAYGEHAEPPPFRVEPNIMVEITNGYIYGKHSSGELAEMWPKTVRYLGFYDYFSVWQSDADMLPGVHGADVQQLADYIRFYANHSGIALTAETGDNWGAYGRGYYLASQLMWNPDVDIAKVLGDFYDRAFHAGAAAMKRFYERFDPGNHPLMCRSLLRSGYDDVADASRAAAGDARVQARLDDIKEYLHYVFDRLALNVSEAPEERRRLTLDLLTETYRTRRTYMNHWRAIWTDYTPRAAKEFKEPSWSRGTPGAHPWQVEETPSHGEVEGRFEKERDALPVRSPTAAPMYSKTLVRLRPDPTAPKGMKNVNFVLITPQRFGLASDSGEPVEFTVQTAIVAAYANKPAARYTIRDGAEHVLGEGQVPLDYREHKISQAVSGPGVYYLDFNDSGAGYKLAVQDGRAETLILDDGKVPSLGMVYALFFYVPKHTKTVSYFWTGSSHTVHGPDGAVIQKVDVKWDWVDIPVTKGLDGTFWVMTGLHLGTLKFASVPNYVAPRRDALLVPEDVARADGLDFVLPASSAANPSPSAAAAAPSH